MLIRFDLRRKLCLFSPSCQILAVVEIKTYRSIITVDFTISDGAYTVQKARSGDASYCPTQYLSTKISCLGYTLLYPSL